VEEKRPTTEVLAEALSPIEFESYCAEVIRKSGWHATTTKASGDQGIDVLATRNGFTAIFQCKKYSSPVGNKAVQEAIAGKAFASADIACVVSTAQYTQAAKDLAAKAGVYLLHYSELADLNIILHQKGDSPIGVKQRDKS
jgi:restriction system protein